MTARKTLATTLFTLAFFASSQAHAISGWLGGNIGAAWTKPNITSFVGGPTLAFFPVPWLGVGGRIEGIVGMGDSNASNNIQDAFDEFRCLTAAHVLARLPIGSAVALYGGGLAGIDISMSIMVDMFTGDGDAAADWVLGAFAGADFFVSSKFSLGGELAYHRLFKAETDRILVVATLKWQFGSKG